MNTKLTLKLNETTISLTSDKDGGDFPITPTVKELSGILKIDDATTPEELRDRYLMDKYLNE